MDVEQTMRFILDTQAKIDAAVQMHDERIARIEAAIEANTSRITQLVDVTLSLAHHAEETDRRLRQLGEETDRRIRELGQDTDYRLNSLIKTVDKLVQRNGHTNSG